MATIEVTYNPNKKQRMFHMSDATETVYGGAKGGGKSCALVMETLAYALENAGATCYLFRETYDDLEANLIREWKQKVPKQLYTYNEGKHIARLMNGSTVLFRYVRNWDDANSYQGRSMDFIGVDELTKHEESTIQELQSCLRSPLGFKPIFRSTCNPGGIGHGWVKKKYIEATNYGERQAVEPTTGNRIAFIPATVYDNDVLMKNDPMYVKRLENLPEDQKKAYLYGDWDIFVGMYFREWRRDKHVIRPFKVPSHWNKYRSIDWGFADHCAVYWHTNSPEGRKFTYRELYINQTLASDVAKKMKELTGEEEIQYTVASPDMWQRRGTNMGESIADTFMQNGIYIMRANNNRILGWNRMRENLADAEDGIPYWQIFENCENLIRTLPSLVHDDKKVEDVSGKVEDHPAESARYFLMSHASPTERINTGPINLGYNFDREYSGYDEDDDDERKITFYS
jgi:phage terminase large subunit